jgi:hypothetical protein
VLNSQINHVGYNFADVLPRKVVVALGLVKIITVRAGKIAAPRQMPDRGPAARDQIGATDELLIVRVVSKGSILEDDNIRLFKLAQDFSDL